MEIYMGVAITTLVSSGAGSFLGAYLKKKGENLATHEDIDDLVDQVRAVTTTTKEIEAKISNDVWDRQKRWELKREVLFGAMKKIAVAQDALQALCAFHMKKSSEKGMANPVTEVKVGDDWRAAEDGLNESALFVDLTCGSEMRNALSDLMLLTRELSSATRFKDSDIFLDSLGDYWPKLNAVKTAMRKEILIEGEPR
jgi:hypothetical protein